MAKNETKRLRPALLQTDTNAFAALQAIGSYTPVNKSYATETGNELLNNMQSAAGEEARAEASLKAARDNAVKAEWEFHNYILGVKDQVRAQYGDSSNELQSLGLKKKAEYRNPAARQGESEG